MEPLIAIVGPTASGKTAVGIALAKRLNGEIISADAVAVYRKLDIGSAKPDAGERAQADFHLIDIADPDYDFTVAEFAQLGNRAIAEIQSRGRVPIIVGGTGLYVRALTATLSVPEVPPQPTFRAAQWALADSEGPEAVYRQLEAVDPAAAAKIALADTKRAIRALEVWHVTGQPMSSFHTPEGIQGIPRPHTFLFGLNRERATLYKRIERRVDAMMETGFLDEVRGLLAQGYGPHLKSMQSLGYRHLATVAGGQQSLDEAVEELKRDTRRFAKKQLSWFNADARVNWIAADDQSAEQSAATLAETLARMLEETAQQQQMNSATFGKDGTDEQAAGKPARHVSESSP